MNNSNSMFARATPILFGALFLIGLVAPFAVYPTFLMKILCFGLFACAFNLLLGRRWPPRPGDLEDAEAMCHQLGLGPLLERMPTGLQQLVGETGWQLSHGERSRVFLARALLQDSELVVLDETFGALDAQATEWCLYRANAHPGAVVVVAHP